MTDKPLAELEPRVLLLPPYHPWYWHTRWSAFECFDTYVWHGGWWLPWRRRNAPRPHPN